jgi:hypothetical protein
VRSGLFVAEDTSLLTANGRIEGQVKIQKDEGHGNNFAGVVSTAIIAAKAWRMSELLQFSG